MIFYFSHRIFEEFVYISTHCITILWKLKKKLKCFCTNILIEIFINIVKIGAKVKIYVGGILCWWYCLSIKVKPNTYLQLFNRDWNESFDGR